MATQKLPLQLPYSNNAAKIRQPIAQSVKIETSSQKGLHLRKMHARRRLAVN
jgi:hypothetical protein